MVLEGNELEKSYDNGAGKVILDVDAAGSVKLSNVYEKAVEGGLAKIKSVTEIETNIFVLAEAIAKKTETTLDDKAVAGIKAILGIKDAVVEEPAG